jgi:2-hydroxy-6-oxonona-2,4-dienedioate hydrolase
MAVQRHGRGPDLVLFHGGMGSWKHWIRNVEPLATRFTVHALDHPAYGASASVEHAPEVNRLLLEFFASGAP